MLQQHIAAIRDIPLVGHDQDGNTKYMTASWNEVSAKTGCGRMSIELCHSPMPCALIRAIGRPNGPCA